MFARNFASQGWAKCEGQLLAISQNTALFSMLSTTTMNTKMVSSTGGAQAVNDMQP